MVMIGEAMKKARLQKGYTRAKLAQKSNVSHQNISKWEAGEAYPNIINLLPVADALDISLDELVGRSCER